MHREGKHKIHAEFGHFSSLEHFSLFEEYAVRNADSLGMNEVELQLVLDFWAGKVTDINDSIDSSPNLEQVLALTKQFF
jgi:ADP-dependent phosphofructokinase/glucokinase